MAGPILHCVQCSKEYKDSDNPYGGCSFHRLAYTCCGKSAPCQHGVHRSAHHHDYPYAAFFLRAHGVLQYTDTHDVWATAEDQDLDAKGGADSSQRAMLGRLYAWVSRGAYVPDPTVLLQVGRLSVRPGNDFRFLTFTVAELAAEALQAAAVVAAGGGVPVPDAPGTVAVLAHETAPAGAESFARAEWLVCDGAIVGARLSAKAASSNQPHVVAVHFDQGTLEPAGPAAVVSRAFESFKPATPYVLPAGKQVGARLQDPSRSVRTDFKTVSFGCPVKLLVTSSPPLAANDSLAFTDRDVFKGTLSIFNRSQAPVTIASVSSSFRLLGTEAYESAIKTDVSDAVLPLTIQPHTAANVTFSAHVPRPQNDKDLDITWWNRAFVARKQPLRLRIAVQDMDDNEAYIVAEYVHKPHQLEEAGADDFGFVFLDDPERFCRYSVRFTKPWDGIIEIAGTSFAEEDLNRLVFRARREGTTEVDLKVNREIDYGSCVWNAWALVDLSCNRVYAFKVLMEQGPAIINKTRASLVYFACPDYGDSTETRPIQEAAETVVFPELAPEPLAEVVWEDSFDDVIDHTVGRTGLSPAPSNPQIFGGLGAAPGTPSAATPLPASAIDAAASRAGLVPSAGISPALEARLASLDANLSRTATALDKLVGVLEALVATKTEPK